MPSSSFHSCNDTETKTDKSGSDGAGAGEMWGRFEPDAMEKTPKSPLMGLWAFKADRRGYRKINPDRPLYAQLQVIQVWVM